MSVNHPTSKHYRSTRKHAFLFSLGEGRFRRWNPERDGKWAIVGGRVQRVDVEAAGEPCPEPPQDQQVSIYDNREAIVSDELKQKRLDRLWEHGLHEEKIFNSRLNFFLVFESVLLGVVAMLSDAPTPNVAVLNTMIGFGIAITIIWGYIQVKHKHSLEVLVARVAEADPDYRATAKRREDQKWFMKLSILWLLAYAIPVLVLGIWITLLFVWV